MSIYPPKEYYSTLAEQHAQNTKPTFIFSLTDAVWWKWVLVFLIGTLVRIGYDLLLEIKHIPPILPLGNIDLVGPIIFGVCAGICIGAIQKSTMIILGKDSWIIVTLGFFGKEKKSEAIPFTTGTSSLKKQWFGWTFSLSTTDGHKRSFTTQETAWRFPEQKKNLQELNEHIGSQQPTK